MTFKILIHIWRKPGTTMTEFIDYYENNLWLASTFPQSHVRHYVERSSLSGHGIAGGPSNVATPAVVIGGEQKDVDHDVISEHTFEDEAAWNAYLGVIAAPEAAAKLAESEAKFVDIGKTIIYVISHTATWEKK
ncbi:hypothetical protein B0H14DRAFT_2560682 [Mycena olivaceomarginata]|nr:hypothetical protein B0H14DRAFT_2560682 [Mycena olivaceomarginata]